jgi:O-antigen/teichoic acid export membrane protein
MTHAVGTDIAVAIVALKTLTLVLGGLITYFALKAYLRTDSPALRSLAIGFGIVTFGSFLAGVADQLLHVAPNVAIVIESALTVVGFGIIVYSLYAD